MMNLENVSFRMPIDDVFELDDFISGIFVTGHIESGTIKQNSAVRFVDSMGNVQFSNTVNKIISQGSIPTLEKKMLEFAPETQDDYWGIALIFDDKEILSCVENGMFVVIE